MDAQLEFRAGLLSRSRLRALASVCVALLASCHDATGPAYSNRYDLTFDDAWGIFETRVDTIRIWPVMQDTLTAYYASWSPDGRFAAFTREYCEAGGCPTSYGVVVYSSADGSERSLTQGTDDYYPAWAPDGSRIAYLSAGTLHTIRPDGTGDQQLGTTQYFPSPPSWSPDSRYLAATRADLMIVVIDAVTGTEIRSIAPGEGLTWSPDGRRIAYGSNGITIADADGRNARVIPFVGYDPTWSPDGNWIAVDNGAGVFLIPPDATDTSQVRFVAPYDRPAWRLRQ